MSDSYHDWDGESLTRSQLYTFRKNPRDFYNRYVLGLAQPRSKALVFGSAFHALTLEGREVFSKHFVPTFERPDAPEGENANGYWRRKANADELDGLKHAWAQEHGHKDQLSASDLRMVEAMNEAAHDPRNKLCSDLLTGAKFEIVAEGIDYETGIPLRCKVDIWTNQGFCCDLKSHSGDLGDSWDRAIMDYGYHFQAAFYRTCTSTDRFPFLVVQKSRNPDVMVAQLDDEEAALGQKVLRSALDRFALCLDSHRAASKLDPGPERNLAIDASWPGIGMAQTARRLTRFPKWFYDKEMRYVSI
tara:strand:- start:1739 stop:2647 length:909 start_codon:yes stop_codon:yes gene_type:complete